MSIKLSPRTITLLQNFASVSPSIVLQPGKVLRVISESQTVFANANIEEDFPLEFPILDVSKLLSILKLKNFKESSIEFEETKISLKGDKVNLIYHASAKELAVPPPEGMSLENINYQAEIKADDLSDFRRACSVLGNEYAVLEIAGGKTFLVGNNPELKGSSNDYRLELGETELPDCKFPIDVSNMKMIDGDYIIKAAADMEVVSFESADGTLQYFIGMQQIG